MWAIQLELDAELLICHVAGLDRVGLRVHGRQVLNASQLARLDTLVARRCTGEPIAYLLGSAWFHGREFVVDRRVLVPRPETEQLVELALAHVAGREDPRIVDVCTGSGCVAVSIAAQLGSSAQVHASDISPDALEIARENAARLAPGVRVALGDLLDPVREYGPFDVITANPPYVEGADAAGLEPAVRAHEPPIALFVPVEGTAAFYARLVQESAALLAPGGMLAVEHGQGQRETVVAAYEAAGLERIAGLDDLAGIDRIVVGYGAG